MCRGVSFLKHYRACLNIGCEQHKQTDFWHTQKYVKSIKKRHWLNWNLYYHYHWFWPKTRDHVFRRCSHMVHVLLNTVAVIFYCSCFDIYIIFLFLCNVHLSSILFFLLKFAKSDELITWLLSLVHEKFAGKYC